MKYSTSFSQNDIQKKWVTSKSTGIKLKKSKGTISLIVDSPLLPLSSLAYTKIFFGNTGETRSIL